MFLWDIFVFTNYIYYCDFFCLGTALRLCDRHRHGWVRYTDTTKNYGLVYVIAAIVYWYTMILFFYYDLFSNGQWCNGEMMGGEMV